MLEIPRLILLGVVLGIASYHDMKSREVPDYIWVVGGGLGAILYIWDWHEVDSFVVFSMVVGGAIALMVWRVFSMGEADVLAIVTGTIVYPVSLDVVMVPVVIFVGGVVLEHIAAFSYNVRYNLEDFIRHQRIFGEVQCSSWFTKVTAFYCTHKRRKHERFTFCAERTSSGDDGTTRHISLKTPPPDTNFETRTNVFVMWAMPAIPFMLVSLVLGVAITYLLMFSSI